MLSSLRLPALLGLIVLPYSLRAFDQFERAYPGANYDAPYDAVGHVQVPFGDRAMWGGTGSAIGLSTVLTVAHTVFNEAKLTWYSDAYFELKSDRGPEGEPRGVLADALYYRTSYSGTLEWDDSRSDMDAAVMTYATRVICQEPINYAVHYSSSDPSPLLLGRNQVIFGYPGINEFQPGLIYWAKPTGKLWRFDFDNDGSSETNPFGYLFSTVKTRDLRVEHGASGSSLCVQDSLGGEWFATALVCTGTDNTSVALSGFNLITDDNVADLIRAGMKASHDNCVLWTPAIDALIVEGGVRVSWEDKSDGETGFEIRRNDHGWQVIATVAAGETSYLDTTAPAGTTLRYQVRAIRQTAEGPVIASPWSRRSVHVDIPGTAEALTGPLQSHKAYRLLSRTGGDAPFHTYINDDLQSGDVDAGGRSYLQVTVMGPARINTGWSHMGGDDGASEFVILVDGKQAAVCDAYQDSDEVILGQGVHTVQWEFSRSATNIADDQRWGLVDYFSYHNENGSEPIYDGVQVGNGPYRYSAWLGWYYNYGASDHNGWIYSWEFGYVWVQPGPQPGDEYARGNTIEYWFYICDPRFGWSWTDNENWPWLKTEGLGWIYAYGDGYVYVKDTDQNIKLAP